MNTAVIIPTDSITEIIVALNKQGQFTILFQAIAEFGATLTDLLAEFRPRGFTVFAPTDAAFKRLPARYRTFPLNRRCRGIVFKILRYHVIRRAILSGGFRDDQRLPTLAGRPIDIDTRGKRIILNEDARVTQANIRAANGVIHVINRVLDPWSKEKL
jgi:uncharacterized surface protein with fasciclin (FAS1) repeats